MRNALRLYLSVASFALVTLSPSLRAENGAPSRISNLRESAKAALANSDIKVAVKGSAEAQELETAKAGAEYRNRRASKRIGYDSSDGGGGSVPELESVPRFVLLSAQDAATVRANLQKRQNSLMRALNASPQSPDAIQSAISALQSYSNLIDRLNSLVEKGGKAGDPEFNRLLAQLRQP